MSGLALLWAVWMGAQAADAPRWLLRYVDRHLREADGEAVRDGLTVRHGTEGAHLGKVVQRCEELSKAACKAEVDAWLDIMLDGSNQDRPDPASMSWEEVAPMLRVRPYPNEGLDPQMAGMMSQMLGVDSGAGLAFVVVIDTPRTLGLLPRQAAAGWGVELEAIYETALAQSRRTLGAQMERQDAVLPGKDGQSFAVEAFAGGFYTTSLLVDPTMMLDPAASYLMVAPSRDVLLTYRIESLEVVDALTALATVGLIGPPPGQSAFTSDLYWWHGGELVRFVVKDDGGKPHIFADERFAAFLETLPKP